MEIELPCALSDLPTPCFLVDVDIVMKNCNDMLRKANVAGVDLRPHVKTHKCHEIARMQVGGDKSNGIIASTIPEVRYMAADGFTDITYGIPVTTSKLLPLMSICYDYPATRVSIFIDSKEQLEDIEMFYTDPQAADLIAHYKDTHHGTLFGCFLKIDVGYHRAGVDVQHDEAAGVELAKRLHESKPLVFRGVYSHSGNAYNAASKAEAKAICTLECKHAKKFADALVAAKIPCPTISIGSTPSCGAADKFVGANEIHPGNYVFFDRQQMAIPVCKSDQVAVRVLTRVIGHYAEHLLCDTGSLAISKDLAPQDGSYGSVEGTELLLTSVSQECGKLQMPDRIATLGAPSRTISDAQIVNSKHANAAVPAIDKITPKKRGKAEEEEEEADVSAGSKRRKLDASAFPRGSLLKIIPNHSCLTAACHPLYFVVRGEEVVDVWRPCRGW